MECSYLHGIRWFNGSRLAENNMLKVFLLKVLGEVAYAFLCGIMVASVTNLTVGQAAVLCQVSIMILMRIRK